MNKYTDYMFKDTTKKLIEIEGFVQPTSIQKEVIPLACKGKDVIGISDTGTGKTHAFLIPIMEKVDTSKNVVQAIITAPTRELATQLYQRAQTMSQADPNLNVRLITGGIEKTRMMEQLKLQPQIVIGTPGRIRDLFINEKVLRADTAQILVVDEADMTLEFGFLEDVDAIAGKLPKSLQMMSFSATIPQGLRLFMKKYMQNPVTVNLQEKQGYTPKIEHILIPCRHMSYEEKLLSLLPAINPYVCLVFANTRTVAAAVAQQMRDHGYGVIELHGDLTPRARAKAMKELVNIQKSFVVATDIAARGIDIEGITHVVSLGFPKELEFYIHRSGRTGRAGKDGICYALYKDGEEASIRSLQIKGIGFHHRDYKNGNWIDLKPLFQKKAKKNDELEREISKVVSKKKVKVKPGYKAKRKAEVEKLKRRAKRELIKNDIQRQKKERAKKKVVERRGE